MPKFDGVTIGEIAQRLDQHERRVAYIIATRRIESLKRIGITRVFAPDVIDRVRDEIIRIDSRRLSSPIVAACA